MLTAADLAQIQAMINAAPTTGEGFPQPIVAGQNLLIPGIQSPNFSIASQTGWQILKSGLAYFFGITLAGGTITGPDYIISTAGSFYYAGTPAAGNLLNSIASAGGTDGFGNIYLQGCCAYSAGGAGATSVNDGYIAFWTGSLSAGWTVNQVIELNGLGGLSVGSTSGGPLVLNGGTVQMQSGTGPYTPGNPGWQAVSLSGGPPGVNGYCRVQLLPWDAVWIDLQISFTVLAANSTTTIGSLPAGYYPASATRNLPLGAIGTVTGTNSPRLFVPESGGLQLILTTGMSGAGLSVTYPLN